MKKSELETCIRAQNWHATFYSNALRVVKRQI